ncbi:hypothetical protein [Alienimonas californiensis]|uniref:Uncharacterized protein n=1 Tax=Alienimonas californiensis TaxID=2527989 RepID=A0A517P7U0_9PLAN|nr:hypothetical protein [Alienimonas californiensis]QDT15446.1 hypothetical protein CA12_15310 [Alienimonas californiensis]
MRLPTSRTACALVAVALYGGAAGSFGLTGCRTTTTVETLPDAYYAEEGVQFFPAGPEFQFPKQMRAIEGYQFDGVADPIGPVN